MSGDLGRPAGLVIAGAEHGAATEPPGERFEVAEARRRVLAAWADSPQRFREDANSEEDLVLGGYRDRVIVELAQNAADAATRAGLPGRLLLQLTDDGPHGTLLAANTGALLDLSGVRALASLRASAKRDGSTVGRFGVGFAAVLAISDDPAVRSTSGGVRFSAAETRALARETASGATELEAELTARDGHVPILRLPFADELPPPPGYDTAVVLPLRDDAARALAERLLADAGDPLLLALPGLTEILIETPGQPPHLITDVHERWHIQRKSGQLNEIAVRMRPVEERGQDRWEVTWAVPRNERNKHTSVPGTIHAPTPTDEPLTLPALLIATYPLDPSRRHVMPGTVTQEVTEHAAEAYADLVAQLAQEGVGVWPLVPSGLAAGALDSALRQGISQRLPAVPMLPAADEPELLLRPRDALAMVPPLGADESAIAELARWVAGLVIAPRPADAAFTALGVRRLELSEVIDQLPQTPDPQRWHRLYSVLTPYADDARGREALASIGIPLADGRVTRGARGLLLGTDGVVAEAVAGLGVKVVHPDAAHPLLERLGATPAGSRAVLELPAVQGVVLAQADADDPAEAGQTTRAVLALVQAAVGAGELAPGDLPWLGELELEDEDGEPAPANALARPGSAAAGWFDRDDVGLVAQSLVEQYGAQTLTAVGVLDGPGLWRAHDVALDDAGDDEPGSAADVLDGWLDWADDTLDLVAAQADPAGAVVPELIAVRDLDLVRPEALPEVLTAIAADPALRAAVATPVRVVAGGTAVDVPSPTAWWLRRELTDGAAASFAAEPGLAALLTQAPAWLAQADPGIRRALGVITSISDIDSAALPLVIERLADEDREISPAFYLRLLRHLAGLARSGVRLPAAPAYVRALASSTTVVVAADDAVVTDAPMYRQRVELGAPLPISSELAPALADMLDLDLASDLAPGVVDEETATRQPIDPDVKDLLGLDAETWCEHEELIVDGAEVDWWADDTGTAHAATLDGLAKALATLAGQWHQRHAVAAILTADPDGKTAIVAESAADAAFS